MGFQNKNEGERVRLRESGELMVFNVFPKMCGCENKNPKYKYKYVDKNINK